MRFSLVKAVVLLLVACAAAAEFPAVNWSGGVTAVYQHADDTRTESELAASADLFAMIERRAGEWNLYLEASTAPRKNGVSSRYPTANADAGSVLNRDGDGGIQISEFNYTFFLTRERSLMIGLIDPSAWLDRSRIANDENTHFLNGSFVNNATIEFPDYAIGGVFRQAASGSMPAFTVVVASSSGIADLPDRSYQDLLNLTADERGAFVGIGAGWQRSQAIWRLGAWARTDDHVVAGQTDASESNYGMYGVFGWKPGSAALNFRVGLANSDVSVATRFASVAWERELRVGLFGIGVARTLVANSFRQADLVDVTDVELFLRLPAFGEAGHITPALQYVENPGFDTGGAYTGSAAIVAGLRMHWSF